MAELLTVDDLPQEFEYPRDFVRVVELDLLHLEPWHILEGEALRERHRGLASRYPSRRLVPFAARQDRDDVACWDIDEGGVSIVHDFASSGWEQEGRFDDFTAWFRAAVEDFIDFGA